MFSEKGPHRAPLPFCHGRTPGRGPFPNDAHTLVSDVQPPELCGINVVFLSHPLCGILSQQLDQTKTPGKITIFKPQSPPALRSLLGPPGDLPLTLKPWDGAVGSLRQGYALFPLMYPASNPGCVSPWGNVTVCLKEVNFNKNLPE